MTETWTKSCVLTGQWRLTFSLWHHLPKALTSPLLNICGLHLKAALIREVTNSISEVIDQKLSTLSGTLEKISSSLENISKRVTEAEQRISDVEDGVTDLAGRLAEAEEKIKIMAKSLDDLENRSRRDNIRIINLKEGAEGDSPIQFFEAWLPTTDTCPVQTVALLDLI
uniref:Uncharacterized protein n=1 Tax=Oreochromis niloticus TaxID=8128 RepID=A0A669BXB9_ORENI